MFFTKKNVDFYAHYLITKYNTKLYLLNLFKHLVGRLGRFMFKNIKLMDKIFLKQQISYFSE